MFFRSQKKDSPRALVMHHGIFRSRLTLWEGVALIISGTVGAGVLGIPFAVAQSGMRIGIVYIIALGVLMMGLNLMVGEIAIRTRGSFQLVGLARHYLGAIGGAIMTMVFYALLFGVLVIYIIGEGETLAALFGGTPGAWSIGFFGVGALFVAFGLRTVKTIELFLTAGILGVVMIIAGLSSPHIDLSYWAHMDSAHLFLPYGVILFAYHGTTAIPEVHATLLKKNNIFKQAILIAGCSIMAVYLILSLVVVGVTGIHTTEIATIGLGSALGPAMFVFGNVFAFFAMATSFLLTGVALKDSLSWDYHMSPRIATCVTLAVPCTIFLLGLRSFITAIDIVGGVFVSTEVLLILLMYIVAKKRGELPSTSYVLRHASILGVLLACIFTVGAVYSVWQLFV